MLASAIWKKSLRLPSHSRIWLICHTIYTHRIWDEVELTAFSYLLFLSQYDGYCKQNVIYQIYSKQRKSDTNIGGDNFTDLRQSFGVKSAVH